jgi:adenylate kinase family enzyme
LKLVIIGATGHGKSTLAKAIVQLTNLKCEVLNTKDLIEASKKQHIEAEDLGADLISEIKEQKYKDKETKTWKINKFYQR